MFSRADQIVVETRRQCGNTPKCARAEPTFLPGYRCHRYAALAVVRRQVRHTSCASTWTCRRRSRPSKPGDLAVARHERQILNLRLKRCRIACRNHDRFDHGAGPVKSTIEWRRRRCGVARGNARVEPSQDQRVIQECGPSSRGTQPVADLTVTFAFEEH